jgi:glutaredoxin
MANPEFVFVTSFDCHFCTQGHDVLARLGLEVREIDIDAEEAQTLANAGAPLTFLPVLWDGTRVVAYGRFSEKRLRRELGL